MVGYGATSDGADMVAPSGEGGMRCMQMALENVDEPVDYINTHGTSTPVGDMPELEGISEVFRTRNKIPFISSTKSMTGHSQGAAGVHEAIYTLLMMNGSFIAPSINIETIEPEAESLPIVRETMYDHPIRVALSNSFGFGGTNAVLAMRRFEA